MAQIEKIGIYVPYYRLKRESLAEAWHAKAAPGERAVANLDEDSLTLGFAAAHDLLGCDDLADVDALYFASTSPPYRGKQTAVLIACALGLPEKIATADFGDSFRAGTTALCAAADAVDAGRARRVLVVAADCRVAQPAGPEEGLYGDGACALLVGPGTDALAIQAMRSGAGALIDRWQRDGDPYAVGWEDRFVNQVGYQRFVVGTVNALLDDTKTAAGDVAAFALSAPDFRNPSAALKALRVDPVQKLAPTHLTTIGFCGVAGPLMSLAFAAARAEPGALLVLAGEGDGCDALLLQAGDRVATVHRGAAPADRLEPKSHISYVDYLRIKGILDNRITDFAEGPSSAPLVWREKKSLGQLMAHRCRQCQTVQYPLQRVCYTCRAKDDFDELPLSRAGGSLFTYTKDYLFQGGDPPQVMAVVESVDGCRLYLQMTDRDPEQVAVGMPLAFTLRRLHEGAGFHNYFWKCRPVSGTPKGGA